MAKGRAERSAQVALAAAVQGIQAQASAHSAATAAKAASRSSELIAAGDPQDLNVFSGPIVVERSNNGETPEYWGDSCND